MANIWERCFHMDVRTIRIIKASSLDREGLLTARINELKAAGFNVLFDEIEPNKHWTWTAGSIVDRAQALINALLEPESDAVMWARGGYGASDLLDVIPWDAVSKAPVKPIIGFSDVCAAQSALYTKTGRLSIHGPMPATSTWKKHGVTDVEALIALLQGKTSSGTVGLTPIDGTVNPVEGRLFGGCLSVLSSLIGTAYLPRSLSGHILYFEDIGENPGRIMRMLNQWSQSGLLRDVRALILGALTDLGGELRDNAPVLLEEIALRYQIPTFHTPLFGHVSPNEPLVLGAHGIISGNQLNWSIRPKTLETTS
jgi:muramoyltetrapeptide carboxypeptidase